MVPNNIGKFKLYNKKPNTIDKGFYYQFEMFFDVPNDWKKRMIRVYLPSDYDFKNKNKRFPCLYMSDGQNLCDEYLSGYGEWGMDECIEDRIKKHLSSFIVVGIDCPYDDEARTKEMFISSDPYGVNLKNNEDVTGKGYGDILANFIINKVKPLIDKNFYTLKDKKHTGIGGSSMGGLTSFYIGMKYKDVIGFSLVFSPAFLCYKKRYFKEKLKSYDLNHNDYGKFFLYTGGKDFEHDFISLTLFTFKYLESIGFKDDQLRLVFDSHNIHHESCWRQYISKAVSFWLDE